MSLKQMHDDALDVFKAGEIGVTQDVYFGYDDEEVETKLCACGAGAAYLKHNPMDIKYPYIPDYNNVETFCYEKYNLNPSDVVDFIHGFDGEDSKLIDVKNQEAYNLGKQLFNTVSKKD